MKTNKQKIKQPTDDEDRMYTAQAVEDGTDLTDEQLSQFKPIGGLNKLKKLIKLEQ